MGLSVVPTACEMKAAEGSVIVASDSTDFSRGISELLAPPARHLAVEHAAQCGIADPHVSGPVRTFAVDAKGDPITDTKTQTIAAYRAAIPISRGH